MWHIYIYISTAGTFILCKYRNAEFIQQYRWDDHALSDEREQILMLSLALYNVCCWNVSFY